jgi:hypothetical protein
LLNAFKLQAAPKRVPDACRSIIPRRFPRRSIGKQARCHADVTPMCVRFLPKGSVWMPQCGYT